MEIPQSLCSPLLKITDGFLSDRAGRHPHFSQPFESSVIGMEIAGPPCVHRPAAQGIDEINKDPYTHES